MTAAGKPHADSARQLRQRVAALRPDQIEALFAFLSGASPNQLADALSYAEWEWQGKPFDDGDLATGRQVLALPMPDGNEAGAATVGDYLIALLRQLWTDTDQFKGKYAFGNSDWPVDLYRPLITAELIDGKFDEHGYVDHIDTAAGDRLIHLAIDAIGHQIGGPS